MKRFEERIDIEAPADRVYAYVSDFPRHGEWGGFGLEVTQDGDGPVQVGTTFSTVAKQFGTQREHSTITEMDAPTRFGWDSTGALGVVHHRFDVAGQGVTTTLTKSAEFTRESFLAKITGWKVGKGIPEGLRSDLANIKARLEQGPS